MGYSSERDTRSTSPLHFLHPALLSHTSCLAGSSASAHTASKRRSASDIARLLDPAYLPASAKTRRSASVSAYIDPSGDMHDPDYRHFPITHSPSAPAAPRTRRTTSPRPHFDWELAVDESALDDEYPTSTSAPNRASPRTHTPTISPARRQREASFSTTTTARTQRSAGGSGTYYSPTGTASTLPTSCEDESPFADDAAAQARFAAEMARERELQREKENEKESKAEARSERRRRRLSRDAEKRSLRRASIEEAPEVEEEQEEQRAEEAPRAQDEEDDEDEDERVVRRTQQQLDFVPTCTQSLQRQWQVLALRFRFGVFRARRRFARRVQSLL